MESTYSVDGYSSPPTPEDRLDLAIIALARAHIAVTALPKGDERRRSAEKMRDEAKAAMEEALASGIEMPQTGSPRQKKITETLAKMRDVSR